jgi:hypothetical protein
VCRSGSTVSGHFCAFEHKLQDGKEQERIAEPVVAPRPTDREVALVEVPRLALARALGMYLKNRRVVEQTDTGRSRVPEPGRRRLNKQGFFENVDPAGLVSSRDRDAELARAHGGCLGTKSR